MHRIRVIPVLLLHKGGLVKSVRFKDYVYVGDPINAVKIFNEKEIDEIVILDIDATRNKRGPNFRQIEEIAGEAFIPLAYGGGITSMDEVKKLFFLGVEKVILNNAAAKNPKLITEAASLVGSQSVVVSIDVKKSLFGKYKVYTENGTQQVSSDPVAFAKQMQDAGAGEVFVNVIDRDGTFKGYDVEIIKSITSALSIPVIACGGAGSVADFRLAATEGGASAVAAGSFFVFQRPHKAVLISYPGQNELKENLYSYL